MKRFLILVTIMGLIGTVTNLLYISPIPSLFAAICFPIILLYRNNFPKLVFWLFLFFIYVFISTTLYYPASFSNFKFYRYDGNFIISYLPLLVLPFLSLNLNIDKIFRFFLYLTTVISSVVFLGKGLQFTGFTGLFLATNAAGGFYSIVTSLAFIYFLERKTYLNLLLLGLNVLFLYATYSRGSVLGLVIGALLYYFFYIRKSYLIYLIFATLCFVQIYILIQTYPVYLEYISGGPNADFYQNYSEFILRKYGVVSTKFNNILIRIYQTWPRAIDCFFHSPLFGTGFGSIDDVPFKFKTIIPYILATNVQSNKVFSDSHAHHSFLHFLGELGLIGLFIFLKFWKTVYTFLVNNNYDPRIRSFLLVSFFNLTIMSFTEHRITTPSNALPFVLALSLYYVYVNYQKKIEVNTNP